jgi:hypothetical protein
MSGLSTGKPRIPEAFTMSRPPDGDEKAIRNMDGAELSGALGALKAQFEQANREMQAAVINALSVTRYIAAIEFEQERRLHRESH